MPTYARPNRRFPNRVGEVPGRRYTLRSLAKPRIVVAIDTSHSMERSELSEVARQLRVLAEHASVTVVECDSAIARVYAFDGALSTVKGRGGTDLRPVFAPEFLSAQRVDGVVYFTDGEGEAPSTPPPVPVLWVLTKHGDFRCPWGARTVMR
jgi:predicted metal-dependent peptidase